MMLTILLGRAGSGKSRRVMEAIAAERKNRRQILLVPEHVSHEAEMDLVRALGATASRDAEVLSFRSLGTRVLQQVGGAADFTLDNGGKILTMRRCLQEICTSLKVFGNPSRRSSFLHQLVLLCDELYAYEITPEHFYTQVAELDGAMGDKLRDLSLIYADYDSHLHNADFDARSRMQKLRDAIGASDYLAGKDLYLDGFSFFNRLEEGVLSAALRQCHSVTVTLLGDKNHPELFTNALEQRERLCRIATQAGVSCEVLYLKNDSETALRHLEKYFFNGDRQWTEATENIALYRAATAFSEVEYVSAQIRRLVSNGCRYRDIAVSARNMDDYGPILEMVFRRDHIPAYISRRCDILEKPVLTLLLGAVDAVTGGFEYEDVFRCLKTGMAGITQDECDLLENYVIRWQIRGNMWLRDTPWTANPEGYGREMTPVLTAQLERINAIREKVRQPFLSLSNGLKSFETARGKAEVIYNYAVAAGVPEALHDRAELYLSDGRSQLAEEYRQLWQIFCDVLDQFVEILGDTPLEGEEFSQLLRLVLTQYSVGTIPATLDQVKVSELTRNDRHRVRYMFLLGANDNVLPQPRQQGGILDDEERRILQQRDIALSDATFEQMDNEMQNIYACLVQPTELLHISWSAVDQNGAELRPSFVVERVEKLFPTVKRRYEDGAFRMTVPSMALSLAGCNPDSALWRYFADSGRYTETLSAMERAMVMQRGRLSPQAVRALYGKSVAMSASRAEQVKTCHFKYFMQYGLRARERKSAGFDAPEIGTFIHYLLENVNREVKQRGGFARVDTPQLHKLVLHYVDEYAATQITGYAEKSARFKYLFSRLRKTACTIVDNMAEELRSSDFVPVAFELAFGGHDAAIPAISVTREDTSLIVTGKVDRVDGWLHNGKLYLRVVDYKTGKKAFDLTDVRYGLNIQMLLYLFALQTRGESCFGQPIVPAGVLYHHAWADILTVPRDISEEKLQARIEKNNRRSGLVLSEPEVLQAMEHSALESPCYLPIAVTKGGTVTGGIATTAQLGQLSRYVDKLLGDIADEIGHGNIDADPCAHDLNDTACVHCPFVSACNFEEGRDRKRYMKKMSPEEFWPFVEEVCHG